MFKRHKKEIFYKQFFKQCNLSILAKRYQYRYKGQTTISRFVYLKRFFFFIIVERIMLNITLTFL